MPPARLDTPRSLRPDTTALRALQGFCLATLVGCSSNVGMPAYRTTAPPQLSTEAQARPADSVRIEFKSLPWWTIAGTDTGFILGFDESLGPRAPGKSLGPIRTRNITLTPETFETIRCAWKIVPMGDPRPCSNMSRSDAMLAARADIETAESDLRQQAGNAGVAVVTEVRCFAMQVPREARLWCEGVALKTTENVGRLARGNDPAQALERESRTPASRLTLHADGSVGFLGRVPTVATTVGLRYRPFEFGFYILDLAREEQMRGLIGVGVSGLGRVALGNSRFDGIAGVSALAVAANGSTNPNFDGLFHGFVGLAYQTDWRISGAAQPFAQLRAGVAHGSDLARAATPMFELHLGLSTPERR